MSADAEPPGVATERLDAEGWTVVEERTETLFRMPGATVRGHTRLYEDGRLRERVRGATGADRTWRFFFATRLEFAPSLSPGGASLVKPTVVSKAKRRFAEDLRDRGFEDVDVGRTETIRVRSGDRARLTRYRARVRVSLSGGDGGGDRGDDGGRETLGDLGLDVVGLLAVWTTDGEFRVAGGAYPRSGLERIGVTGDGDGDGGGDDGYREELIELIRAVE